MANLGTQFECNPIGALADAKATIARLTAERDQAHERFVFWRDHADARTAERDQARAEAAAAYEKAARVLLDGFERAQIDSSIIKLFQNGQHFTALRALAGDQS